MSSSQLTFTPWFFRGVGQPPTRLLHDRIRQVSVWHTKNIFTNIYNKKTCVYFISNMWYPISWTRKFLRIHVDHMSGFNEAPIGFIFRLWRSTENGWNMSNPMKSLWFSVFFCGSSVDLLWIYGSVFQPSTCLSHFLFFAKKNPRAKAGSLWGLLRSSSSLVSEPGPKIRRLAWGKHFFEPEWPNYPLVMSK